MPEVISAFVGAEVLQAVTEQRPQRLDRATARSAHDRFQLREGEFNRIEVGAVRRKKEERRPGLRNRVRDPVDLVRAEIIGNDDVADVQGRYEDLFDIGEEARSIDRAIEHARRGEPADPKRRDEGARFPAGEGRVIVNPRAAHRPPVAAEQVRGDARLVQKHQVRGIPRWRVMMPLRARGGDIRPSVLRGAYRFF